MFGATQQQTTPLLNSCLTPYVIEACALNIIIYTRFILRMSIDSLSVNSESIMNLMTKQTDDRLKNNLRSSMFL